jgi:hypothetical protein
MFRTRKTFFLIVLVAVCFVAVTVLAGYRVGANRPFKGRFDTIGLVQVKGTLKRVQSFEIVPEGSFKFLWLVEVNESAAATDADLVLPNTVTGDVISIEVQDSRANLFVNFEPQTCFQAEGSPVRLCEYEVLQDSIVMIVKEELGAENELPEFAGAPR